MISAFFINRPVLANVLAIVIVLIGGVALATLPIAQYPNIVPPTVQVTTTYPGASAKTVVENVALPIELQVNGVEGMIYMQSYSTDAGTYTLTVTFQIGTDLDFAQVLVQNRVSTALASLPASVQAQGLTVQKKSTSILQIVSLNSPDGRFDSLYLSNYATINLVNELSRLPGVGNVNVLGVGQYSMRVWLDPQKLYTFGLTPSEVTRVIQEQSQPVTAGQVGTPPAPKGQDFQFTVDIQGRLSTPEEFANIIVKTAQGNGGRILRLKDIGRVELGAQTYAQTSKLNGKPNASIAIYQLPEANALDVANRVNAKMAELAKAFPPGLAYDVPFDTTKFVKASINEVFMTLGEAGILVLIVIVIFLQDWRAMLVPATTIPVTIIGAFAAMAALGFTINTTTMFGIVLAIGIVVDDAIVIVEGVARHIERGMTPHDAAIKAMDELFGPVIGITLVLMSVFLPAAFVPGLTGKMFAQFALVIAATAFISAINAATLKPTQCAMWLRPATPPEKRNFFFRGFNNVYQRVENGYAWLVGSMVRHAGLMVLLALVLAGVGGWGVARLPGAFIPNEDQGYLLVGVQLPDGASLERTGAALDQVSAIAQATPGVENVVALAGLSVLDSNSALANAGVAYVILKDWGVRAGQQGQDLRSIVMHIYAGGAGAAGRPGLPAGAAGHPGHRQCGRLPDAGRAARRQLRLRQAAERHAKRDRAGEHAVGLEQPRHVVPRRRAARAGRRRSLQGRDPEGVDRRGLHHALVLSRFGLRQSLQQVRPHPAGLPAGRFAVPHQARRHPAAAGAQRRRPDGADRRPGDAQAGFGTAADQPLQSLSVGRDRGRAGRGLQLGRGDRPDGPDRQPRPCRRAPATNGRRCPTRRTSSATSCSTSSRWPSCWSISAWPASTKAGSRRSP